MMWKRTPTDADDREALMNKDGIFGDDVSAWRNCQLSFPCARINIDLRGEHTPVRTAMADPILLLVSACNSHNDTIMVS